MTAIGTATMGLTIGVVIWNRYVIDHTDFSKGRVLAAQGARSRGPSRPG